MKLINRFGYPNLPVPNKTETLNKFLNWVEPLISSAELENTKKLVDDYCNSAVSDKIQDYLINKTKDKNDSWLSQWWMDNVYLASRGPVSPECNAPIIFTHKDLEKYSISQFIGLLMYELSLQYLDYKNNGITDYQVIENPKVKFSMDQIAGAFTAFREPNKNKDNYYIADSLVEHIVLLKNNICYKIKVIENNKVVAYDKIANTIEHIINNENDKLDVGFNFITAATNRDAAKDLLDDILKNKNNVQAYNDLKQAILVFCFDDLQLNNQVEIFKNNLSGLNYNRFHGKSLLFAFNKNKDISFIADHTFMDGGTELTLLMKFNDFLKNTNIEFSSTKLAVYNKIEFNLSTEQQNQLLKTHQAFLKYLDNSNIIVQTNKNISKTKIKQLGIKSVDGLIHIAFQIAQYMTNKQFRNTYVAVDVRSFFRGRTECIRPISTYSKQFAIKYVENSFRNKLEVQELLEKSLYEHFSRGKDCKSGHGINRHMLGMLLAYSENAKAFGSKPALFDCKAWNLISANPISTSSIVSSLTKAAYFDPVHPDGIGLYYAMHDDCFKYSVSAWKKDEQYQKDFVNNLNQTLDNILKFLSQ